MLNLDKGLEVLSKVARQIEAEQTQTNQDTNGNDQEQSDNKSDCDYENYKDEDLGNDNYSNINKSKGKEFKTPKIDDLLYQKGVQNLEERKLLLKILAWLFSIQMFFMNLIVLCIVFYCIFDCKVFREINADLLPILVDLSKYYITAVLVELLGGIIFIVYSVFSDKMFDNFKKQKIT